MKIVLFDTPQRDRLMPLSLTRAIADIRMGIFTVSERWEKVTGLPVEVLTEPYLMNLYPALDNQEMLLIDSSLLVTKELAEAFQRLSEGEALYSETIFLGGRLTANIAPAFGDDFASLFLERSNIGVVKFLDLPCRVFQWNDELLEFDFKLVSNNRTSTLLSSTVQVSNPEHVFVEEGANLEFCILNASTGPIYIGKGATVMEGCLIRGPFALGEGATLKMGTKVYGATTVGPYCVAGGELKNSVMTGYSNKAHDGYLGDSVLGEWCNLGAGTSNSNVKNTGSEVRHWNYLVNDFVSSGKKGGLIMGDYSRTAINTAVNTGTVAGVCCNIFGEGLTPKVIPNFTWGNKELSRYEFTKGLKDIEQWMSMKNKSFSHDQQSILKYVFDNYND